MIPVIDVFAGPGGLGEGFTSQVDGNGERIFEIKLSIEKDKIAHQTLTLRSFFRHFPLGGAPDEYYDLLKGKITSDELYEKYPIQYKHASEEAWCATLGDPDEGDDNSVSHEEVDNRIKKALNGDQRWVLIGGPPCQAYSLAGRSRRQETTLDENKDKRVGLYKEYLRIIAVHNPAVFIMENVKGLLSAKTKKGKVFERIFQDLSNPVTAAISEGFMSVEATCRTKYRIYSLTKPPLADSPNEQGYEPNDFLIKSEAYGIPQRRHRVILLGVREDIGTPLMFLKPRSLVSLKSVIQDLPKLRSGITKSFSHHTKYYDEEGNERIKRHYTKESNSDQNWNDRLDRFNAELNPVLGEFILRNHDVNLHGVGKEYFQHGADRLADNPLKAWYLDDRFNGVTHHVSRNHLLQDLKRYLFSSRYGKINKVSPKLTDYENAGSNLLPDHQNVESGKFADRFRVQLADIPATTITSHISKDGHYFIHYDPDQCRSMTVREAARVQTFPDNYFFCGGRTQQFHQVGNAVPPYLAYRIADIVASIFPKIPIKINSLSEEVKDI